MPVRQPGRLQAAAHGQQGYALLFVLSLILLLSLVLTGVARDSRGQARAALRVLHAAEARTQAETALSLTVMHLLAAKPEDRWHADGTERRLSIDGQEWRVTLVPEDGKVDLNHASVELLAELFSAAGVATGEAQALADRVADWRDGDDLTHVNGAERRAYEDAGLPAPRNGPFLKPEEIRLVMGMTEEIHACIADAVTVWSGKAGIDRRFAPELLRVKPSERAADASGSTAGATAAPVAAPEAAPAVSPLTFESVAGKAVTIRLAHHYGGDGAHIRKWIIRITEDPKRPWWILSWRRARNATVEQGLARCGADTAD